MHSLAFWPHPERHTPGTVKHRKYPGSAGVYLVAIISPFTKAAYSFGGVSQNAPAIFRFARRLLAKRRTETEEKR